ncbi:sigma 54-interacting transcriptional regulator [Geomonas sp. RF6]|uniref:sigma-54-dependent Fis family transcriptional regulator n=1 Tax=Geomonas sp. RF6 TaxID=2897342 RepID=UPI001E4CBA70|nr:sigma 54-interacting transcriptional regulator [Geomonas sp. RF6]UFS71175.1 sigma 54-interacting transcriptional regulator [Geomonas sp. RF6]
MVDKNIFFREMTVKICSSLEIKTALTSAFEYLREHIPLDGISLTVRDTNVSSLRRVAHVTNGRLGLTEEIIPLPEDLWVKVQSWNIHVPTIMNPHRDELIRELAPHMKLKGYSVIQIPLWVEKERLGWLILRARGEDLYDSSHVELLSTVSEPFAIALANALAHEKLKKYSDILLDDNRFLNKELLFKKEEIIGGNSGLRHVMEMVQQVAPLNNSVLILGETGAGKEVIANAIHFGSSRRDGPFIKVNCGAIPESLMDSELFGHEKGAFTGAHSEKRGRFERADGGTIFLDEIGELPLQAQVRLLRVLQDRQIERVGGTRPIPVDIRVIVATHRNLESMVSENRFREDLWFRLNVFPIIIPPLRQRKEDIAPLARHFVEQKCWGLGISVPPQIAPGALQRLMNYGWPGNVRELENLVERELILHRGGQLYFDSVLPREGNGVLSPREVGDDAPPMRLDEAMALHISSVLKRTNGKIHGVGGAAELLGLEPNTLRARMDKLGIKFRRREKAASAPPLR